MPTFKMTDKLEPLDFLFSEFHVFLFIILLFCVNTSDRFLRVHGSKFLGSFLVVKYFYMNRLTGYRITSFFLFLKFSLHFNISVSQMLASLLISFYFISFISLEVCKTFSFFLLFLNFTLASWFRCFVCFVRHFWSFST